ncbi:MULTISPECIES: sensor histidine kinase [unclassified Sedimentibacter]|uniref:sensor histidine kinase n=1 Tax=unclassified Sedimentibacter TaxID=2649220 RepID=UPI0027E120F3|nr:sensor histidine kinase [Sedimentibacter sp. MB35-C1]WMJ77416.1 sensor histidine kinase [Sedimentibacter sp. MB35-C1]
MSDVFKMFLLYLKQNIFFAVSGVISLIIFVSVFFLYSLPLEPILYAVLLTVAFIAAVYMLCFVKFYKRHRALKEIMDNICVSDYKFPDTLSIIEEDYQELIKKIDRHRVDIINEKNKSYSNMLDYYTIWAHQIKTPISAMRLILQSEKSEINEELLEQLFKTEQYVEMVLQYIRLENLNSDLLFKKYSLDNMVKQVVRKYSKLFIRKKINLVYENLNMYVLTDEKWLVFVIEQLISNSLKYTNSGEISIYMDETRPCTLVIEDTGIGIEKEDLPRVFEKGYTGYNGRADKKSTGIGLYLCRQILNRLSHSIEIESEVGKGTKVKVKLETQNVEFE